MELLFEAIILGLIAGAVPGPILTGTFAEILNSGLGRGMKVIILALLAETLGALISIYIFYKLGVSESAIRIISILGAVVLFWLASKVWQIRKINSEDKKVLTFWQIMILTALNSGYWIFWLTVGIPKALILDQVLTGGKFIFLGVFELAWLAMTTGLAIIFFKFRPILERRNLVGTTFKILAIVLALLGIRTLLSGLV